MELAISEVSSCRGLSRYMLGHCRYMQSLNSLCYPTEKFNRYEEQDKHRIVEFNTRRQARTAYRRTALRIDALQGQPWSHLT
jgi:hypothetical protein